LISGRSAVSHRRAGARDEVVVLALTTEPTGPNNELATGQMNHWMSGLLVLEVLNKYHILVVRSLSLRSCLKVDCAWEEDISKGEELAREPSPTSAPASAWQILLYSIS
jgi:hypothetical protein